VLICLWTLKAGSGCSVTIALAGLQRATHSSVTLVDPHGDLAAVLGVADPAGAGVRDWIDAGDDAPPQALAGVACSVAPGLQLVGPGTAALTRSELSEPQLAALEAADDTVLVDAGCVTHDDHLGALARRLAAGATRSILVTRPCYLSLRRVADAPVVPSAVVLLTEPGRALRRSDVEQAVGAPVVASIAIDPAIARAVDAGLLVSRPPRGAARALAGVT
jgi:hypothetical protein